MARCGREGAAARLEELLHDAVFEAVERDHGQPAAVPEATFLLIPHVDGLMGQGLGRSSCTVSFETMDGSRMEAMEIDGLLHDVIPAAN